VSGFRVGPTHPVPPPTPNPDLDCYIKSGETPKYKQGPARRPDCALSNLVYLGGAQVCYGEGAVHNERCPENRRQMRRRDFWTRVEQVTIVAWGLGLLLLVCVVLQWGQ
jgi:hypothetical protein